MSSRPVRPRRRWKTVGLNLLGASAVLFGLTFLPPDNSLAEVQKSGVLRVCVPPSMPPLVTDDSAMPGFDIELLGLIAEDLGVRLVVNHNAAIGADFNPRNWGITRAQCQIIAGGVVANESTRGFLELLPTGIKTGWAMTDAADTLSHADTRAAVFPGPTALDRLALSRYLRSKKIRILPASSVQNLVDLLQSGEADILISDRQTLTSLNLPSSSVHWVSEADLGTFDLSIGLWKGDATLLRAVKKSSQNLHQLGVAGRLAMRYNVHVDANLRP